MVVKGEGGGWAGRHEGEEQVGGNSNFPFHILTPTHPHTDPFMVDPMNGELVLVRSLNFESRTAYSLNVTVMDGGDPIFSDSALVNISVQDINDNTPLFNASSYTVEVFEGNYTTDPLRIVTVRHTQYVKGNDIV